MGYLRTRSSSLWPWVILHATHNTFIQGIFDPLTASSGWAKYITTEFGIGLVVTMIASVWSIVLRETSAANSITLDRL